MTRVVGGGYHPTAPAMAWPDPASPHAHDAAAMRVAIGLERAGWDAPGWDVTLRVYGSGDERHICLADVDGHVAGDQFLLSYNRPGAVTGEGRGHPAHMSLSRALVPAGGGMPAMRVTVRDAGRLELATYSGTAWAQDRGAFAVGALDDSSHVHLFDLDGARFVPRVRPAALSGPAWDYDYSALVGYAPLPVAADAVAAALTAWLRLVADRLSAMPERRVPVASLAAQAPEQLERPFVAHLLAAPAVADRVLRAARGEVVQPWARWAARPGRPLLRTEDHDAGAERVLPPAWDPLAWLSAEAPDPRDLAWLPVFRCAHPTPRVVRATVREANDAWVADLAAADEARARLWDAHPVLTDADAAEVRVALARTMVPLRAYQGNHRRPLLLLARELRLDETSLPA